MKKRWLGMLLVLALLLTVAVFAVQAEPQTELCPHCKTPMDKIKWSSWSFTGGSIESGHYYLTREYYGQTAMIKIPAEADVCLDLRGKMYFAQNIHPFDIYGDLTVMDTEGNGQFITTGSNGASGGFAKVKSTGVLNILSGTIRRIEKTGVTIYTGGLVYVEGGTMNVSGGALIGGIARANSSYSAQGGNIYMKSGTLNVSGGIITGGMALSDTGKNAQGGNIFASTVDGADAVVNITGGVISDGYSDLNGGNLYLGSADLRVSGDAEIFGGHAVQHGGNIAVMSSNASVSLNGVKVSGGVAGGKLNDADQGSGGGGNIYGYEGEISIADSTISGDVRLDSTMTSLTLSGVVKLGLGKSNGMLIGKTLDADVSALQDGSEIFVQAVDAFTLAIPQADAQRIAGYFKGAIRTAVTLEEDFTLKGTQGTTGYCPHCYDPANPATVTWTKGLTTSGDGHCYLSANMVAEDNTTIGGNVILDLNGYTLGRTNRRIIMLTADKSLTVLDSAGGGKMEGTGTVESYNKYGGLIDFVAKNNTFTLYSGTVRMNPGTGTSVVPSGGVIYSRVSGSQTVINGGVISGGVLKASGATGGGNIYMLAGDTLTVNAGIIKGGDAGVAKGGNIYNAGTTQIKGGFILGGKAADGGNLYTTGTTTISGGTIYGGTVADNAGTTDATEGRGGNLYATGTANVSGGTVNGGKARIGGNAYVSGTLNISEEAVLAGGVTTGNGGNGYITGTLNVTGGLVTAGKAYSGGNFYIYADGKNQSISGGLITAGIAEGYTSSNAADGKGGNFYVSKGTVTVSGTAVISRGIANYGGGNAYVTGVLTVNGGQLLGGRTSSSGKDGGNVYAAGGTLNVNGGELVNGYASQRGGNIYMSNGTTKVNITGGTVTGGYAYKFGGNLCHNAGITKITGGTVSKGSAARGGNLYLSFVANATMTIDGADCPRIIGGTAKCEGGNIYYAADGSQFGAKYPNTHPTPWLAIGNCDISEGKAISFGQDIFVNKNAQLRVLENFRGKTYAYFFGRSFENNSLNPALDTATGDFSGMLILENWESKPFILHKDGVLKLPQAASVKDGVYTWFVDNAALMEAYDATCDYIVAGPGELELKGGDYIIDMAGNAVNITGTGTVTGMDSANDSYKTYGSATFAGDITLASTNAVVDGKNYFALREDDTYTFHRLDMDITGVTLRPEKAGLYYTAQWQCDEALAKKVEAYGVAMSLAGVPGNDFATDRTTMYTRQTGVEGGITGNGVLVKEILKSVRPDKNSDYAQKPIYAVAYVTVDGQNYTGKAESYSLHDMLKMLSDNIYEYYSKAEALSNFMDYWDDYGLTGNDWQMDYRIPEGIVDLLQAYDGLNAYQGELHDHANTGGTSDGNYTLTEWLTGMQQLDMDFAAIVDHKQYLHMELPEWDNKYFIGGSEAMAMPKDLEAATQTKMHFNMIFSDPMDLKAAVEEYDAIAPGGGFRHYVDETTGEWHFTYLQYFGASESGTGAVADCRPAKADMAKLIEIVRKHNGMFVHVHPTSSSYIKSTQPLDYWFADWTGLEVYYTIWSDRNSSATKKNYQLWLDLLDLGKKVWATAGNDEHAMPTNKALSTIYATEQDAEAFMKQLRIGNFTAGHVGVQMTVGDQLMGGECDFTGKQLAFRVGDFHSTVYDPTHTYRADLYTDQGLKKSMTIDCEEPFYYSQEADETARFYRVEIHDVTTGEMLALGNPIWNTAAQ